MCANHLSLSQLEDAVHLLLNYKDCFVGASGKVGWTDRAAHLIETGKNLPDDTLDQLAEAK